jgi:hypothetical protein
MAKRKKSELDSLGPAAHWLDLSVSKRAELKQYIRDGFNGGIRSDGVSVPGVRRIYRGLFASDGFDLRHIERWSAAKLAKARNRIQSVNTLTSRPFAVIIPRSAKQKREAQKFTGQNLKDQKEFIAQVQIQNRDKAVFRGGKVGIERKFPSGSKTIKQRYLFRDYLRPNESLRQVLEAEDLPDDALDAPTTFREMREVTKRMLLDMPAKVYGQSAYFALITSQYGPIGRTAGHGKVLDLLAEYFNRYDPGGTAFKGHEDFAEQIIGFQMIGTFAQVSEYEIEKRRLREAKRARGKLRFAEKRKPTMCPAINKKTGRRCGRKINHKGKHRFPK